MAEEEDGTQTVVEDVTPEHSAISDEEPRAERPEGVTNTHQLLQQQVSQLQHQLQHAGSVRQNYESQLYQLSQALQLERQKKGEDNLKIHDLVEEIEELRKTRSALQEQSEHWRTRAQEALKTKAEDAIVSEGKSTVEQTDEILRDIKSLQEGEAYWREQARSWLHKYEQAEGDVRRMLRDVQQGKEQLRDRDLREQQLKQEIKYLQDVINTSQDLSISMSRTSPNRLSTPKGQSQTPIHARSAGHGGSVLDDTDAEDLRGSFVIHHQRDSKTVIYGGPADADSIHSLDRSEQSGVQVADLMPAFNRVVEVQMDLLRQGRYEEAERLALSFRGDLKAFMEFEKAVLKGDTLISSIPSSPVGAQARTMPIIHPHSPMVPSSAPANGSHAAPQTPNTAPSTPNMNSFQQPHVNGSQNSVSSRNVANGVEADYSNIRSPRNVELSMQTDKILQAAKQQVDRHIEKAGTSASASLYNSQASNASRKIVFSPNRGQELGYPEDIKLSKTDQGPVQVINLHAPTARTVLQDKNTDHEIDANKDANNTHSAVHTFSTPMPAEKKKSSKGQLLMPTSTPPPLSQKLALENRLALVSEHLAPEDSEPWEMRISILDAQNLPIDTASKSYCCVSVLPAGTNISSRQYRSVRHIQNDTKAGVPRQALIESDGHLKVLAMEQTTAVAMESTTKWNDSVMVREMHMPRGSKPELYEHSIPLTGQPCLVLITVHSVSERSENQIGRTAVMVQSKGEHQQSYMLMQTSGANLVLGKKNSPATIRIHHSYGPKELANHGAHTPERVPATPATKLTTTPSQNQELNNSSNSQSATKNSTPATPNSYGVSATLGFLDSPSNRVSQPFMVGPSDLEPPSEHPNHVSQPHYNYTFPQPPPRSSSKSTSSSSIQMQDAVLSLSASSVGLNNSTSRLNNSSSNLSASQNLSLSQGSRRSQSSPRHRKRSPRSRSQSDHQTKVKKLVVVTRQAPNSNSGPDAKVGIGISFGVTKRGAAYITGLSPNGPARACGQLRVGDQILSVDGADIKGWQVTEIVQRILGKPGTQLSLEIVSASEQSQPKPAMPMQPPTQKPASPMAAPTPSPEPTPPPTQIPPPTHTAAAQYPAPQLHSHTTQTATSTGAPSMYSTAVAQPLSGSLPSTPQLSASQPPQSPQPPLPPRKVEISLMAANEDPDDPGSVTQAQWARNQLMTNLKESDRQALGRSASFRGAKS